MFSLLSILPLEDVEFFLYNNKKDAIKISLLKEENILSFDINKIVDNFEKKENNISEIKKVDIEVYFIPKPSTCSFASKMVELDKISDRIIDMINAANKIKRFKVDYQILSSLLWKVAKVECHYIRFDRKIGYKDGLFREISFSTENECFSVDGINIFNASVAIDYKTKTSYYVNMKYPSTYAIDLFLKEFDIIENFFYNYLECLSKGDIFKKTNHTIYRIPAGSSTKEIYYDDRKSTPVLKTSII